MNTKKELYLIVQTEYEHEKSIIENALNSCNIPYKIEFKKILNNPTAQNFGPWAFLVDTNDKTKAQALLKTLPITQQNDEQKKNEKPEYKLLVYTILAIVIVFFILKLTSLNY